MYAGNAQDIRLCRELPHAFLRVSEPMKITIEGAAYVLHNDGQHLGKIRALPARDWDGRAGVWRVPMVKESYQALRAAGFDLNHLPVPTKTAYQVTKHPDNFLIIIRTLGTPEDILRCRRIPEMRSFDRNLNAWLCKPTRRNVQYIRTAFPQAVWDGSAEHLIDVHKERDKELAVRHAARVAASVNELVDPEVTDYIFKTKPYDHQLEVFRLSRKQIVYALLMEQGTGKTKVVADTAAYNFYQAAITGMLVICPNGVKYTWLEELETHLPGDVTLDVFIWEAKTRHKAEGWILRADPGNRALRVLIMNVEALSGEIGTKIADLFLSKYSCLMTVDEFTRIKSPVAARTKNCLKLGKKAVMRRILSGVPITQGPLDIFSPFKFLDQQILGFSNFYSMRNRHAIMGGWQGKQVIGYANLEELQAKVKAVSYRCLRSECLDLPGKVYEKLIVELTPKQRELYNEMASEMKATLDWVPGETPTLLQVAHAITKVMRLQQIVGGFIPLQEGDGLRYKAIPIPGDNPKLLALLDALEDLPSDEKVVIWAHFRPELAMLAEALRKQYGNKSVAEFHGGIPDDTRQAMRRDFQMNTSGARFFVGQEQAGGLGLTLTASCLTYYFSNGQSLENRLQSEDREDRIGQTRQVIVTDIAAKNSSDYRIIANYRNKKRLADLITGDPTLSWL
jgi:hypothetical protein